VFGGNARSLTLRIGAWVRFGRDVVVELERGEAILDIGRGTTVGDYCHLRLRNGDGDAWEHRAAVGIIQIGTRCEIRSFTLMRCLHQLTIGDDVRISHFCVLHTGAGTTIGDRCAFAERVTIADTDHGYDPHWIQRAENRYDPVSLAENVLLSANAVVTRGTHLPPGVIVGAGTIVRRGDYSPGDVIVGDEVRSRQ
jgi:acetyltransferase-like isoleucine patch superfamily enzyme